MTGREWAEKYSSYYEHTNIGTPDEQLVVRYPEFWTEASARRVAALYDLSDFKVTWRSEGVAVLAPYQPKWVVITETPGAWRGVAYYFFDREADARAQYEKEGDKSVIRPYESTDKEFLR